MNIIYSITGLLFFIFLIYYSVDFNNSRFLKNHFFIIIIIGLIIKTLATNINLSLSNDIYAFKSWSIMLYEGGLSNFYKSDTFTDYPPAYMYILFIIGFFVNTFGITYESEVFNLLIKLPGIIFDIITGILVYNICSKKTTANISLFFSLIYILNPAVILNSSIWGQVDSVYTFTLLLSIYFLTVSKYHSSYLIFTLSILIKPQSLILTPIYVFSFYAYLKTQNFSKDCYLRLINYILSCFISAIVLLLPFALSITPNDHFFNLSINFMPIIQQYINTIASYPYVSINAYNIYSYFGLNWQSIDNKFLLLTYSGLGLNLILIISIFTFYLLNRNNTKSNHFFAAGVINTLTFMFSVKMHERYLYPSLVFFLISYIYVNNKKILLLYTAFSATFFINCLDLLYASNYLNNLSLTGLSMQLTSLANIILTAFMIYTAFKCYPEKFEPININNSKTNIKTKLFKPVPPQKGKLVPKINNKDILYITILTAVYSIIALINLGDFKSPQTTWYGTKNKSIVIQFDNTTHVTDITLLSGPKNDQSFNLEISIDGDNFEKLEDILVTNVFAWKKINVDFIAKYVKITPSTENLWLQELAFLNKETIISGITYNSKDSNLFDEQDLVAFKPSYKNSTYFDEIYHARTAYEFINRLDVYETTHPPLGKVIISWGIQLFGMTPFGFRIMGTLFGILMVPLVYIFSKKVLNSTNFALTAAILYSFDFMHFTQTRIATIDTYNTFFVILMYFSMYLYYNTNFYYTKLYKTLLYLMLCGIFMGLAVSSKWQGIYASIGLAVIFFITIIRRYREYLYAKENNIYIITKKYFKNLSITFYSCILFFIIIPIIIYVLSYIPYLNTPNTNGIKTILNNQKWMLHYHSTLISSHPYESPWWQWPFNIRPVFYYADTIFSGENKYQTIKSAISSFGNPFVWWGGVFAFFCSISILSKKYSKTLTFLLIAFLSQVLPWIFVSRSTFIYHYMPSIVFIVLIITYCLKYYYSQKMASVKIYTALVILLFIIFYPILSGLPVYEFYVTNFLRWLPTWQLI